MGSKEGQQCYRVDLAKEEPKDVCFLLLKNYPTCLLLYKNQDEKLRCWGQTDRIANDQTQDPSI